jgi:hypothetical protein
LKNKLRKEVELDWACTEEGRNSRTRCTRLESPRIPEKRSPTGNVEKDGDKRVGREGKELE